MVATRCTPFLVTAQNSLSLARVSATLRDSSFRSSTRRRRERRENRRQWRCCNWLRNPNPEEIRGQQPSKRRRRGSRLEARSQNNGRREIQTSFEPKEIWSCSIIASCLSLLLPWRSPWCLPFPKLPRTGRSSICPTSPMRIPPPRWLNLQDGRYVFANQGSYYLQDTFGSASYTAYSNVAPGNSADPSFIAVWDATHAVAGGGGWGASDLYSFNPSSTTAPTFAANGLSLQNYSGIFRDATSLYVGGANGTGSTHSISYVDLNTLSRQGHHRQHLDVQLRFRKRRGWQSLRWRQ